MEVDGRVALVTGGGYGIGRGIAKQLAAAGACVVVDDVHDEHGAETVQLIGDAGGKAAYIHGDTTNEDDVQAMTNFAVDTFGSLDIVVNNAGGAGTAPYYPNVAQENWRKVLDWYLIAYMNVMQQALEHMPNGGSIVNISSMAGVGYGPYPMPEYAAAKAAIIRLTGVLATLASTRNVRVNCIAPNWVATEALAPVIAAMTPEQKRERYVPDNPATPEDIGDAVLELVRDDSMAGRILHHYAHGEQRLVPLDMEF